jgi:hypothetical protein
MDVACESMFAIRMLGQDEEGCIMCFRPAEADVGVSPVKCANCDNFVFPTQGLLPSKCPFCSEPLGAMIAAPGAPSAPALNSQRPANPPVPPAVRSAPPVPKTPSKPTGPN